MKEIFEDETDIKNKKVRHWALTLWEDPQIKLPEGVRYAIYGDEICPKSGRRHWQTYIELNAPQRFSWVKNTYGQTAHVSPKKKTREQARDYCKKDGKFEEYGKWIKGQGHRTDLDDLIEDIAQGANVDEIIENHPREYLRYPKGINDMVNSHVKINAPKWRNVEVILITGPTGCGKTREAMENGVTHVQDAYDLKWWDGYHKDEVILLDEYDNDNDIKKELRLLDGHKKRLEIKGGTTYAYFTKVYITTNLKIHEIHPKAKPEHRRALFRRFSKIISHWNWDDEVLGNTSDQDLKILENKIEYRK
uniref:Replication-associated protein n=1 Tax=Fringilla montifringilla CRESS-DNA-virus sp. TaxID=2815044 RepID=A0A8A4XBA1_9VIRU|nr:MAG: replication-associated protein [Fringilla montifringilla CRESS-DNA-virus sp.]